MDIIIKIEMTLILGKYKSKKRLGKGAYGDVLLAEDLKGNQIAIKMINKKIIQKDPFLQQYLDGERQVMISVKSKYIMELYSFEQDENYKYFICEYCDGGDLLKYQSIQPYKIFTLKHATQILAEVINGLELLHYKGYLHRDIKPQNILLKKTEQQGKFLFKLADFGFAKKSENVGGTVLGTEHYMSPQIYSNEVYGYEVDMWAFGVLFYFMLNMDFPFKTNPHAQIQQKRQQLIKQATDFSFREAVKNKQLSKKPQKDTDKQKQNQMYKNCTNDVEDLFKRMLNPVGARRINFVQIRQHALFREYFPVIEAQSRILYKSKKPDRYGSFVQQRLSQIHKKPANKLAQNIPIKLQPKPEDNQYVSPSVHIKRGKTGQQKAQLETELDRTHFLYQLAQDLSNQLNFLDPAELLSLRYNLLKYYVILMKQFYLNLKPQTLDKKYPKYKWKQFAKTPEYSAIKSQAKQDLDLGQMKVSQCYGICLSLLSRIKSINAYFELCLEPEITTKQFDGNFKQSYRVSTNLAFQRVRARFSNGNKYVYLTCLVVIAHAFSQIYSLPEDQLRNLFSEFVQQKKLQGRLDFGQVKSWLSTSSKETIKSVLKRIVNSFFL